MGHCLSFLSDHAMKSCIFGDKLSNDISQLFKMVYFCTIVQNKHEKTRLNLHSYHWLGQLYFYQNDIKTCIQMYECALKCLPKNKISTSIFTKMGDVLIVHNKVGF